MFNNKNHWYDGKFYDKFIAPNQDRMFSIIYQLIEKDSKVLDVGCGTGRFSFNFSDKFSKVVGVDLSIKNIETANQKLLQNPNSKLSFYHSDVKTLKDELEEPFDYAIITYVLHEVNPNERLNLLNDIFSVAKKIIIGDYLIPQPKGLWKMLNEVVEFLAGSEHYNYFKDYQKNGGLMGLIEKENFNIINNVTNKPITSQILVIEKRGEI